MVGWHLVGFALVVTAMMMTAKMLLPNVQGVARFGLFCLVVIGTWYAHSNYYIQSGPFLRDEILAPILGKRPPAERLSYALEVKVWKDPNIRQELKKASVLERSKRAIELANAGIFRLSDARQMRWLEISTRLFEVGEDSECVGMTNGTMSVEALFRMLNRLSEPELREYFEIVIEAVAIGVTPGLPAPLQVGDTTAIMRNLMSTLPLGEQERFRTTAITVNIGASKDSCWFEKTLFTGIATLPSASRTALLQSLAGNQPSAQPPTVPLQMPRF